MKIKTPGISLLTHSIDKSEKLQHLLLSEFGGKEPSLYIVQMQNNKTSLDGTVLIFNKST